MGGLLKCHVCLFCLTCIFCSSPSRLSRQAHIAGADGLAACGVLWTLGLCAVSFGSRCWPWHQQQEQRNTFVQRYSCGLRISYNSLYEARLTRVFLCPSSMRAWEHRHVEPSSLLWGHCEPAVCPGLDSPSWGCIEKQHRDLWDTVKSWGYN